MHKTIEIGLLLILLSEFPEHLFCLNRVTVYLLNNVCTVHLEFKSL